MSELESTDAVVDPEVTTPLPKDPQPSVDRVDELARRILTGDIVLPKFQRGFVWDRSQILSLLDSVAKGFPIGSVLLWQSRQELRSEIDDHAGNPRTGGLEMASSSCERCEGTIRAKSGARLTVKFTNDRYSRESLRLCNTCANSAIAWLNDSRAIAAAKAARTRKLRARGKKAAQTRAAANTSA